MSVHASQRRPWQPGDDPQSHPLWAEQVALELEMATRGSERYWAHVEAALDPGANPSRTSHTSGSLPSEMSRVSAYRRKMEEFVPVVAEALQVWLAAGLKDKRKADRAHAPLQKIQPGVAAFIAITVIMDRASVSQMKLMSVAASIGIEMEHQARMLAWVGHEKNLPPEERLFHGIKTNLKRQQSTARHVRRVNINRFNKLMRSELEWSDWGHDIRISVGLRMVSLVVEALPDFAVIIDPAWNAPAASKSRKTKFRPAYIIQVSDRLIDELEDRIHRDAMASTAFMPTVIPPKRWDGVYGGGYYSPCVRRLPLIGIHNAEDGERRVVLEEFNALHMPKVYEAINTIQETPWRINERVLDVAKAIWDADLGIAGITRREAAPRPPKPPGWEQSDIPDPRTRHEAEAQWEANNPEAVKTWKVAASDVHRANAKRASKASSVSEMLRIADRMHNREFYFPHHLDFRGRMYPIPPHLQPQGSDLARGLLCFAYGRPIGDEGADWLAVHVANCYGHDKLTFEERKAWVVGNEEMLRSVAASPLKDRRWVTEADGKSQWQALAATFEWVRYLDIGPSMVSVLPIRVDGTCNGIQHLAAMMKDEVVGERVNLLPGDQRRDIYMEVAAILQARLEVVAESGGHEGMMAAQWLCVFDGSVPRAFTKQPVMSLPFGATSESRKDDIWAWLSNNDDAGVYIPADERGTAIHWLLKHLEDAMESSLGRSQVCMGWFKKCAQALSVRQQTAVWIAPSGFPVRHAYRKTKPRPIEIMIDGRRLQPRDERPTDKLDTRGQLQGIVPNFVQSLDGSANMETLVAVAALPDPMPITAIHDAFGTIPARMPELSAILRKAFVDVHSRDVMADFRNGCVALMRDDILATERVDWAATSEKAERLIPALPPRGRLDVGQVVGSRYFFS